MLRVLRQATWLLDMVTSRPAITQHSLLNTGLGLPCRSILPRAVRRQAAAAPHLAVSLRHDSPSPAEAAWQPHESGSPAGGSWAALDRNGSSNGNSNSSNGSSSSNGNGNSNGHGHGGHSSYGDGSGATTSTATDAVSTGQYNSPAMQVISVAETPLTPPIQQQPQQQPGPRHPRLGPAAANVSRRGLVIAQQESGSQYVQPGEGTKCLRRSLAAKLGLHPNDGDSSSHGRLQYQQGQQPQPMAQQQQQQLPQEQQQLPQEQQQQWLPQEQQQQQWLLPAGQVTTMPSSASTESAAAAAAAESSPAAVPLVSTAGEEDPLQWVLGPDGYLYGLPEPQPLQPDVCVVKDEQSAKAVVDQLLDWAEHGIWWTDSKGVQHHEPPDSVFFACDTEVAGIDIKKQSPVGHGTVICFSIYAGPWADLSTAVSSVSSSSVSSSSISSSSVSSSSNGVGSNGAVAAAAGLQQQLQRPPAKTRIWVDLMSGWSQRALSDRQEKASAAAAAAAAAAEVAAPAADPWQQQGSSRARAHKVQQAASSSLSRVAATEAPPAGEAAVLAEPPGGLPPVSHTREELEKLTREALRQLAKGQGLPATTKTKKADLVSMIWESRQQQATPAAPAAAAAAATVGNAAAAPAPAGCGAPAGPADVQVPAAAGEQHLTADDFQQKNKVQLQQHAEHVDLLHYCDNSDVTKAQLVQAITEFQQQGSAAIVPQVQRIVDSARSKSRSRVTMQQLRNCLQVLGADSALEEAKGCRTREELLEVVERELANAAQATTAAATAAAGDVALDDSGSSSDGSTGSSLGSSGTLRGGSDPVVSITQVAPASSATQPDGTTHFSPIASSSSSLLSQAMLPGQVEEAGTYPIVLEGNTLPPPTVEELRSDPTARAILQQFSRFFTSPKAQKVWHNYGFDRHVLEHLLEVEQRGQREEDVGKRLQGFGGDTLHMSRLYDASRKLKGGYSLESLSSDKELMAELKRNLRDDALFSDVATDNSKRSMKERFGVPRKKDSLSPPLKVPLQPAVHLLQIDERFKHEWIDYSALDAKATWNVHRALRSLLLKKEAIMDAYLCEKLLHNAQEPHPQLDRAYKQAKEAARLAAAAAAAHMNPADAAEVWVAGQGKPPKPPSKPGAKARQGAAAGAAGDKQQGAGAGSSYSMWDLYKEYWWPFGEVLSAMESEGVRVDRQHLAHQEKQAYQDQEEAQKYFRKWASKYVKGAELMNVNSQVQIRQLLFPGECAEPVKTFKASNPEYDPNARPRMKRWIDFELHGIWGKGEKGRLTAEVKTSKGTAAVSGAVLWSLVGKPGAAAKALVGAPGAAAKALAELDAKEAAAAAAADGSVSSSEAGLQQQQQQEAASVLDDALDPHDLQDDSEAAGAAGAVDADVLRVVPGGDLTEDQLEALQQEAAANKWGKMYAAMGGGREGLEACVALEKLIEVSAIDKLLSAFIQPLQQDNISTTHHKLFKAAADTAASTAAAAAAAAAGYESSAAASDADAEAVSEEGVGADGTSSSSNGTSSSSSSSSAGDGAEGSVVPIHRVHCSLNLNTETGRLSARRPNLQNQPAMEKDRYKVRKAFCAEPGNTLVVADYGQLELRLLAHMANCQSMIRAFELGGDFHSRTALGMYDYIQEAIDRGECLLEWDGGPDHKPPPVPLLKDKFGSERRKAKILNFSIAYGKTAHGLSKDWGVSLEEAEETVCRWYSDRPEVEQWQAEQRAYAANSGFVNTMIGRRRGLRPGINSPDKWVRARAERAAINTPIQGSAADVASAAMLAIVKDPWLQEHNWRLLLQVHDEVMLEGPKETAEEALEKVRNAMENPWQNLIGFVGKPLRVDLVVDAKIADNWYEAK